MTVTPSFCRLLPSTVVPSMVEASFALQWILMIDFDMTLTLLSRQYQPLGFIRFMVERLITLTFGLMSTSAGLGVSLSSVKLPPIPNTLTRVPMTRYVGSFALKGWSPQLARHIRTAVSFSFACTIGKQEKEPRSKKRIVSFRINDSAASWVSYWLTYAGTVTRSSASSGGSVRRR